MRALSMEEQYIVSYSSKLHEVAGNTQTTQPKIIRVMNSTSHISAAEVLETHDAQTQFLKDVALLFPGFFVHFTLRLSLRPFGLSTYGHRVPAIFYNI